MAGLTGFRTGLTPAIFSPCQSLVGLAHVSLPERCSISLAAKVIVCGGWWRSRRTPGVDATAGRREKPDSRYKNQHSTPFIKICSPNSRSRGTISHHRRHSGQFGLPSTDGSPGKTLSRHTETNMQTKKSAARREGGGSWHQAATRGSVQHSTAQFTTAPLEGDFREAPIKYLQPASPFCCSE